MKNRALVLAALATSTLVVAQADWVNIGETASSVWDIQAGSLEESKTKGGIEIVVAVGRVTSKTTKRIDVGKWYVSVDDCARNMGKLVALDLDGKYRHENDVVFGAGNIASEVAEMICGAYKQRVEERIRKGI